MLCIVCYDSNQNMLCDLDNTTAFIGLLLSFSHTQDWPFRKVTDAINIDLHN